MDSLKIAAQPWAKAVENKGTFPTALTHFFTLTTPIGQPRKFENRGINKTRFQRYRCYLKTRLRPSFRFTKQAKRVVIERSEKKQRSGAVAPVAGRPMKRSGIRPSMLRLWRTPFFF
jgi:hypothetical protein